jgi:glutamyl-tRNA synthetase
MSEVMPSIHYTGAAMVSKPYRGRIAPSPTGLLHLGHARTFRVACESARAGTLVLRNEDLDPQRSRAEFAAAMVEDLHWLGIDWQEGPDVGGPFAPYVQSQRRALYLSAWRTLVSGGFVYPCTCSRRELAASAPNNGEDDEPLYSGHCRPAASGNCRPAPGAKIEAPESPAGLTWRFRVPDDEAISFDDGHFGKQTYTAGRDFGDFPIWRRDDVPAYQLACVVDDSAMQITEVVRGEDLLKSTARQLLLYRALGLAAPAFFHCPLVRDAAGRRLAKRTDALSLRSLRERGHTRSEVLAMAELAAYPASGFPEAAR